MTPRTITTGQDNWQGRRPYNDAARRHAYGPLQPMPRPTLWQRIKEIVR